MAGISTKVTENVSIKVKEKRYTKMSREKKNIISGLLFASPVLLGFIIFVMGPMIASGYFSLTDYSIASTPKWIGFDNYKNLFTNQDPFFYKSLLVTATYVFLSVPIQIVVSLLVAMLLNSDVKGKGIFRTIFYLQLLYL